MFGVLEVVLCRDPIPGQSLGAGQIQIALIVSLGVLGVPRLGAGEPRRTRSPGLGCSRICVGHVFGISVQLCRRWMTFRSVVHIGPYAARRKPRDVDWRNCRTAAQSAGAMPQRAAIKLRCVRGGWARRSIKHGEQAERIRADEADIGSQSGVFKLPEGGAVASGSNGILRQWRLH